MENYSSDQEANLLPNNRNETNNFSSSFTEQNFRDFLRNQENENIEDDIATLYDMGFNLSMINKVYLFLKPRNVEEAIQLLSEENGIYQHHFYQRTSSQDSHLCFICKKERRFHIGYVDTERNSLFDLLNLDFDEEFLRRLHEGRNQRKKDTEVKPEKKTSNKECVVCFSYLDDSEIEKTRIKCGHVCCEACWMEYLKTKILEANVSKITCVQHKCTQGVSEKFILQFIQRDNKLLLKYERFKKRAKIINDPNKKFCPYPNCESYLEKEKGNKYVECQNGHQYCYVCLKPWHKNTNCDQEENKDFQLWKKGKVIKQCPNCKFYTEKNEGCNHMTCAECKYQWCWLCEGKYSSGHYTQGRCNGHQFSRIDYLPPENKNESIKKNVPLYNVQNYNNYNNNNYNHIRRTCCCRRNCRYCCCCRCLSRYKEHFCSLVRYLPMIWFFGVIYIAIRAVSPIAVLPRNDVLFFINVILCYALTGLLLISFQLIFTGIFTIIAIPILFVWPLIEPFEDYLEDYLASFDN